MSVLKMRRWGVVAALVAAVALAGCGDDDESAGNDTEPVGEAVTLLTREYYFEPDTLTLPAGPTEFVIDNSLGVIEHDFNIDEFGVTIHADPGRVETGVVTLESGTYDFYCSIPGHREAGMEGTLTVN
jgi:uncharacterized cupredoxin-like copper-binding protein